MKEYIFNFYRSGEVRFVKSISAESKEKANYQALQLFNSFLCYDEYALSV